MLSSTVAATGLPHAPSDSGPILIVEPDPNAPNSLSQWACRAGYQIFSASDIEQAVGLTRLHRLDRAVLGLELPGWDPARLCETFCTGPDTGGLWTMVVKQLVEAHHGRVGLRSAVGKGATFWFTLPIDQAAGGKITSLLRRQAAAKPRASASEESA